MSDEGDKTCPLCAEEMDLTDQQLKPCKCGYEICVWCWHHIMEMAEKDETEGRCPACRTPYDKERIVGTTAKCERLVAEINMEKKQKSQKAKSKTSESRKQLSTVRVIQRNLVYIVGLPLNLADEELLQQKMYFAQYGKVLKVSISRTSAGTIQQFPNNTCSVYITYSKEEEAVCCIQSVHGFTLDGRPLRACFGTTKYCHAWLRNVPCNNPDCLYLHEIGSQEDSFTKDEIISAHTRVQQITGFTNNIQRRSGNVLPPPADDHCNDSSSVIEKPVVKNSLNAPAATARCTPGANSSGKSGALPPAASWGSRASSCKPPAASLMSSNELTRQKAEVSGLPVLSRTVSNSIHGCTVSNDHVKDGLSNGETHAIKTKNSKTEPREAEQHGPNSDSKCSEVSSTPVAPVVTIVNQLSKPPVAESNNKETSLLPDTGVSIGRQPFASGVDEGGILFADGKNENLSSEMSKMSIDKITEGHSDIIRPNGLCLDKFLSPVSKSLLLHDSEKSHDHSTSGTASTEIGVVDSLNTSDGSVDWKSDVESHGIQKLISESEDGFDSQRLRDAVAVNQATVSTSPPLHLLSHLRGPPEEHADATNSINYTINPTTSSRNAAENLGTIGPGASVASNRFFNSFFSSASAEGNSCLRLNVGQGNHTGEFDNGISYVNSQSAVDLGENNIISNMLEVDPWDDSWTSQNLPRLLADADKQVRMKLANSWKGHISNESRFSFARQEDSRTHLFDFQSSFKNAGHGDKNLFLGQSFIENKGSYVGPPNDVVGFMEHNIEPSNNSMSSYSAFPSSKISSSRSHISAPPGFSAPSRPPPPPGFSTHGRIGQALDTKSGNHSLETTSLLRSNYEAPSSGNISTSDIELIDPAILAVGEGRLPICVNNSTVDMIPNFHVQTPFENYTNLQLLMQRSLSPHQNLRYAEVRDGFRAISDAYGYTSQHMEQSQTNNFSPSAQFSLQQATTAVVNNGHWDGWNEFQTGGDVGVAELLRNDRLGFNKFGMTSSGDLYNRSFGM